MHNILYLTILCSFFSLQSGYGFILIPTLILLIAFSFRLWFAKKFTHKDSRFAILLSTIFLVCSSGYHLWQYRVLRQQSDAVVTKIIDYKNKNKTYPLTLDALKISTDINFNYRYSGGNPILSYGSSFSMFDIFIYDFTINRWSKQKL